MDTDHVVRRAGSDHADSGNEGENSGRAAGINLQRRVCPQTRAAGSHAGHALPESGLIDITIDLTPLKPGIAQRELNRVPGEILCTGSWNDPLGSYPQTGDRVLVHSAEWLSPAALALLLGVESSLEVLRTQRGLDLQIIV